MEAVRKNKELKQEELDIMKEHGVPDWYVESCGHSNTYSSQSPCCSICNDGTVKCGLSLLSKCFYCMAINQDR